MLESSHWEKKYEHCAERNRQLAKENNDLRLKIAIAQKERVAPAKKKKR